MFFCAFKASQSFQTPFRVVFLSAARLVQVHHCIMLMTRLMPRLECVKLLALILLIFHLRYHNTLSPRTVCTNFDYEFTNSKIMFPPITTGKLAHVILIVRATDKIQPASLSLNIVGEDGEVLNTTSVIPVGTSGAHFSATFSTPSVPFKLQLQGRTKGNFNFQRNSQSTVTPRHVVVKVLYARNEFTVPISGYEFTIFFAYNTGPTEVFDFKVRSTTNFEAQSSRSSARIYRDRMAFFSVRFTATPSAVRGAADRMLVTVTGRTTRVTASYLVSLMVI